MHYLKARWDPHNCKEYESKPCQATEFMCIDPNQRSCIPLNNSQTTSNHFLKTKTQDQYMECRNTIILDNQRDTFIDIFKLDNVG